MNPIAPVGISDSISSSLLLFLFLISHLALITAQLFGLLQWWRYCCSRIGWFMMSRKFELAFGLLVIAFEYRPERWDSHQQNVLGIDVDQDASTRLWSNLESITQWLLGSL